MITRLESADGFLWESCLNRYRALEKRQQIYTYGSSGQISSPGSASSAAPHVMYMKSERGTDDRK